MTRSQQQAIDEQLAQLRDATGPAADELFVQLMVNHHEGGIHMAEFAAGHATQARNIPFGSLEGSRALPTNKAVPLLLMCPTGARAQRAVATLRKLGYEKATAVIGGLNAWREAQLPVEKSAA